MKTTSKIIIVFALMCVNAAAAYSQDCNSYLRQATELLSQKKFCEAKVYYQRYSKCNADADVSTEIAMCERRCKIEAMEGGGDEPVQPVVTPRRDNPPSRETTSDTRTTYGSGTSSDSRISKPPKSVSPNSKFKLGLNGGLIYPPGKLEEGVRRYLFFGGGINGEYLATPNFGIGLSAAYYAYQVKIAGVGKTVASFMPVTLTGKYYFLTENIQPYVGADVGLYRFGQKVKWEMEGKSESDSDPKSYFGLSPVVGLQFKLSDVLALDVNSKCNFIFLEGETRYNFGFNVGIVFKF